MAKMPPAKNLAICIGSMQGISRDVLHPQWK